MDNKTHTKDNKHLTKVCVNCKYAKGILNNVWEIYCVIFQMNYDRTDRCGEYEPYKYM